MVELQNKLEAVPPTLFVTLYENATKLGPRAAAVTEALEKSGTNRNVTGAPFDIGMTDVLASERMAKMREPAFQQRLARENVPEKTLQEFLQPAIDQAAVVDKRGFAEARSANLKNFGIPDTAQNIGLYDMFSPFTSQTRRALDFVQRTQGKPEQFIADLKKVVEKQRLGIRPKDLDASGLLQAL